MRRKHTTTPAWERKWNWRTGKRRKIQLKFSCSWVLLFIHLHMLNIRSSSSRAPLLLLPPLLWRRSMSVRRVYAYLRRTEMSLKIESKRNEAIEYMRFDPHPHSRPKLLFIQLLLGSTAYLVVFLPILTSENKAMVTDFRDNQNLHRQKAHQT